MRRGMNGLALQVQQALGRDPHAGDLYAFRGRRGDLVKILWHDGLGMALMAAQTSICSVLVYAPHDAMTVCTEIAEEPKLDADAGSSFRAD